MLNVGAHDWLCKVLKPVVFDYGNMTAREVRPMAMYRAQKALDWGAKIHALLLPGLYHTEYYTPNRLNF